MIVADGGCELYLELSLSRGNESASGAGMAVE